MSKNNKTTSNNNSDVNPLVKELNDLVKKRDSRLQIIRTSWFLFLGFFIVTAVIAVLLLSDGTKVNNVSKYTLIALGIYNIIFPLMTVLFPINNIELRINQLKDEIDLQGIGIDSLEARAEKQFKQHQAELKRYYDQSLRHGAWIFYIGIANLFVGFLIIGITLFLVSNKSSDGNLIVGFVGGIAGVLTNFVAVIFLRMYSGTVKSLSDFHNRLVSTNHLLYSNLLVSKIFDNQLRSETWAKLALSIPIHEKHNSEKKDSEIE